MPNKMVYLGHYHEEGFLKIIKPFYLSGAVTKEEWQEIISGALAEGKRHPGKELIFFSVDESGLNEALSYAENK